MGTDGSSQERAGCGRWRVFLETEMRALHDGAFAQLLDEGAKELADAVPMFKILADQLTALKPANLTEGVKNPGSPQPLIDACECVVAGCNAS